MIRALTLVGVLAYALCAPFQDDGSVMDQIWQARSDRDTSRSLDSGGVKIIEMDIVNTPRLQSEIKALKAGVLQDALADPKKKWPNGVVPYVISAKANSKLLQVFANAIEEFNAKTCVKFVPRVNEADYLFVFPDDGCYSHIGRQGGKQDLSLGRGCEVKGIAIHEMMHAIGFFHEQSRRDRDSYIKVFFENIRPDMRFNFDMYLPGRANTLGEPYDKKSVMHYGNRAFSSNGQKTIVSLSDPNEVFGQREQMSEIDARQINRHYKCASVKPEVNLPVKMTSVPSEVAACLSIAYKFCQQGGFCAQGSAKSSCTEACKLCEAKKISRDDPN